MPKARKVETEVTPSVAKPAPVRRRAATAGTKERKPTAPQTRVAKAKPQVENQPVAAVTEPVVMEPVAVQPVVKPSVAAPTHEQIASLAYSYWVKRGYQGGSPEQDWLAAEHELRSRADLA